MFMMVVNGDGKSIKQFYASKSYWLESSGENLEPRAMLEESKTVDIAIMGAGFSGLWTAYYLLLQNPSLNIVILEKEIAGYGASGRNGGFCSPHFPVSPAVAIEKYGKETARKLQLAMFESVSEIGRVIQKEGIDADWVQNGSLRVALGDYGLPNLENGMKTYKSLGLENQFEILNKDQTNKRVRIHNAKASLLTKSAAALNPGKLVRQLANLLEQRGVKIYEQTEVLDFKEGDSKNAPKLITSTGVVTAKYACVLAGEAYMSQIAKFRRKIIPTYSLITLTEPLTEEQWASIGWEGRETVGSTRYSINYLQRTIDGRILFGGRGQPYRYASKIKESYDIHKPTHDTLKRMLLQWFPTTKGIQFTHSWGGPVGINRDWTPNFIYDKQTRIASATGFVGQGVSTTNLAGRILSDLILEQKSEITELPMVQHASRKWEVEPFRWLGAHFVQYGLERVDKKAESSGIPPKGTSLAERLGRH